VQNEAHIKKRCSQKTVLCIWCGLLTQELYAAWKAGMKPHHLHDIEIRGKKPDEVKKPFKRANLTPYIDIASWHGSLC